MNKAPDAFRTISEVAEDLDLPQHVLRFWESRFIQIKPMKRGGGRRYYRPDDVDLLRGIRHLLYGEGYTIRGVQRILRDPGPKFVQGVWRDGATPAPPPRAEDRDDAAFNMTHGALAARPGGFDPPGLAPAATGPDHDDEADARSASHSGPEPGQRPGLSSEGFERLRAALDELLACKQLLDEAVGPTLPESNG